MSNERTPLVSATPGAESTAPTKISVAQLEAAEQAQLFAATSHAKLPARVVEYELEEQQIDAGLPRNKAFEELGTHLATSRVRLHRWRCRLYEYRARQDFHARLQLIASLASTLFASLTAIFSIVSVADSGESSTLGKVALAVAICNALAAAVNSTVNTYISQQQRNVEDREPETSRASVAALKCWRREAATYIRRFEPSFWGGTLEADVETLVSKLPADVVIQE